MAVKYCDQSTRAGEIPAAVPTPLPLQACGETAQRCVAIAAGSQRAARCTRSVSGIFAQTTNAASAAQPAILHGFRGDRAQLARARAARARSKLSGRGDCAPSRVSRLVPEGVHAARRWPAQGTCAASYDLRHFRRLHRRCDDLRRRGARRRRALAPERARRLRARAGRWQARHAAGKAQKDAHRGCVFAHPRDLGREGLRRLRAPLRGELQRQPDRADRQAAAPVVQGRIARKPGRAPRLQQLLRQLARGAVR
mmetsp:Transcript_10111/g.25435  ORF Transcript_10111/g.25435 Transcript_10111/m.25435 type:complete len:254 (+) Transcript_10111:850-1611(+)